MAKSIASSYLTSSNKSFVSSILKNPGVVSRNKDGDRVRFKLPSDLSIVFSDIVEKSDRKRYEELISAVRDSEIKDGELYTFLRELRQNVSMLNKSLYMFVDVLLKLKWAHRLEECSAEYGAFLVDLLSTHNYYTRKVLESLIETFKSEECYETVDGALTENAVHCCNNLHNVLEILLKVIPMASQVLCEIVRKKYPYLRRDSKEQESFVTNILRITLYYPEVQREIFHIVIQRLIMLDVSAPKAEESSAIANCPEEASELLDCDLEDNNPITCSLDVTLNCVFQYIHTSCYSGNQLLWDRTLQFYDNLLVVFNEVILPTDTTDDVQFLLFYICSFHDSLLRSFMDYLWSKAFSEDEELVIKQKAVAYLVSMVASARFVPVSLAHRILARLTLRIHEYIDRREAQQTLVPALRVHMLFYSLCQAVFYLTAVRHYDLLCPKQNLEFVQKLNLAKVVTSRLNPLRVCHPDIIDSFAEVANTYQLAYCHSIIEENSRHKLPVIYHCESGVVANPYAEQEILTAYFPFDSFLLPRSKLVISPLHRQFEDTPEPLSRRCEDDDDFMSEQLSSSIPNMLTRLSVSES